MPRRQLWFFQFGCWSTIVGGVVHLAGHMMPQDPPANATERQLIETATSYHFAFPGGAHRSVIDFLDGFSLAFALMLVALGSLGLIVQKRGRDDVALMSGAARCLAVMAVMLMIISLTKFFIVPTLFIAVMAICFLVASVESPIRG